MKKIATTRSYFIALFVLLACYFLLVKTELYESRTALIVRDLSSKSSSDGFSLSLLGGGPSSQIQDSMVVEEYLLSLDVFALVDSRFRLTDHFKSDKIDFVERLSGDATMEEILEFYRKRLQIVYDETSGILHVSYIHSDPVTAKEILGFLIENVEQQLNAFNHRKAKKQLDFIETQYTKHKEEMEASSLALETYQNANMLLDPNNSAASSSAIIASLETSLTEKKIELSSMRGYLNENSYEIRKAKDEIRSIKNSIAKIKNGLSGSDKSRLNKILFEYEKLKMDLEFKTEVYKNTLIQLETAKLDAAKEAKTLSVLSQPNLPDGYTYPDKPKVFITLLIVSLLMYGIFSMLASIIRDHRE